MRFQVIVLGATHLVRQSIAQPLVALGARVLEFASADDLLPRLELTARDLLVMDTDGMQRQWRAVARAALLSPRRLPLVLLAGAFGFDDAHDALALGVSTVILKPFRAREHMLRLYDLVLKQKGVRPRRGEPRFALSEELSARLDYEDRDGSGSGIVDGLSRRGLSVSVSPERLLVGSTLSDLRLSFGAAEVGLTALVVHRGLERAGLRVLEWGDGRQKVLHLLDELALRAFGGRKEKRRW